MPGYSINMPEFDLANPLQADYRVSGLTNVGHNCGIYLAIHDHDGRWWDSTKTRELNGMLQLTLIDSRDQVVVNVSGRLGDFIWWGARDMHGLYQMAKSFFSANKGEEYRFRIAYQPDPKLAGYKGFACIRSPRQK